MQELERDYRTQSESGRNSVRLSVVVAKVGILGFEIADVGAVVAVTTDIYFRRLMEGVDFENIKTGKAEKERIGRVGQIE